MDDLSLCAQQIGGKTIIRNIFVPVIRCAYMFKRFYVKVFFFFIFFTASFSIVHAAETFSPCAALSIKETCLAHSCSWDEETKNCREAEFRALDCSERDGGAHPFIAATTYGLGEGYEEKPNEEHGTIVHKINYRLRSNGTDFCLSDNLLMEYYCNVEDGALVKTVVQCPSQCNESKCASIVIKPTKFSGPKKLPTELSSAKREERYPEEAKYFPIINTSTYECRGCVLENKCYPKKYRIQNLFCATDGNFIPQLEKGGQCTTDSECLSKVCLSGQCTVLSFPRKIVHVFAQFFGKRQIS